ncbi:MAG: fumarate hydratase [Solirubrobacterales bacterium]
MESIQDIIKESLRKTTFLVSSDCEELLREALDREDNPAARQFLASICENMDLARTRQQALCQSPGYLTVYVAFGDRFFLPEVEDAIRQAVVELTQEGYCRPSIVDSLTRSNNGDNSGFRAPNFEYEYRPGADYVEIIPSFKGCGVELFNQMKVFTLPEIGPGYAGIKRFILNTVQQGGGKPCLPGALGIGIGGQMDVAAKLSRKAVSTRSWKQRNEDPDIARLEEELLEAVNDLNIGCGGIGGRSTILAVNIETAATHTAICPVAINFHCWMARRDGLRIYPNGRLEAVSFAGYESEKVRDCVGSSLSSTPAQ